MRRFLAGRVGAGLADDLAAETVAVACRRWASFDPSRGTTRAWLLGIASVLLRAHWREEQELLALEARLAREPEEPASGTDELASRAALTPALAEALARLSPEHSTGGTRYFRAASN